MNKIRLLILDVDGVLTDGKKYYDNTGSVLLKTFCDKDWTTIKRFKSIGLNVVFITGDPFNKFIEKKRNIKVYLNRKDGSHIDKKEIN
jgi:3-deoxy-D-manno-octulosonate 8-phosphate phosphatase KdsC-like HAD superfamily phosphatase